MRHELPSPPLATVDQPALDNAITAATRALLACQRGDGHWAFELEADSTIPAEYVLLKHYLDEPIDATLEQKFAVYLRPPTGRSWRLANVSGRRLRYERERKMGSGALSEPEVW